MHYLQGSVQCISSSVINEKKGIGGRERGSGGGEGPSYTGRFLWKEKGFLGVETFEKKRLDERSHRRGRENCMILKRRAKRENEHEKRGGGK